MTQCDYIYFEICFVTPEATGSTIFRFAEFISALALLVIVYTLTDIRYKFRLSVAPIPLYFTTYILIGVIGFGTLITEIWLKEQWLVPLSLINQPIWEGMFAALFLLLAMMWIYYAFIRPPIFSKQNYRSFARALYRIIVRGSDSELPVIADELARSANSLIRLSLKIPPRNRDDEQKEDQDKQNKVAQYAYDLLLLIGNRKLCRHIIASSPGTAISFFEAMERNNKYEIPMHQFAQNITREALINRDSILYHEDEAYRSGLLGYLKPFSQAIYGNYHLVETLASGSGSPLDVGYDLGSPLDASQLRAYSRAVLTTLGDYIKSNARYQHSSALYRAIETIQHSSDDLYKLKEIQSDFYSSDIVKRLRASVEFIQKAVTLLGKEQEMPPTVLRVRNGNWQRDFYDYIADAMFEIIFNASHVEAPSDDSWFIQHNLVWNEFFSMYCEGKAWPIIRFKLRRLLYDEIRELEEFPNYKSARILGYCLNVMGLRIKRKGNYGKSYRALHKAVLAWTIKNYPHLLNIQPTIAESCLIGSISFDKKSNRLIKTFASLNSEPPKDYLQL